MRAPPALLILNPGALATARRVQAALAGATLHGFAGRVEGEVDTTFADMGAAIRELFRAHRPIVGFCATGILIRLVAPLLADKRAEPPVIAVSEDGRIVIPLLGSLTGANELAHEIAAALGTTASVTGSGARRFDVILERPPVGWRIANPDAAKSVTAALLAGASVRVEGDLPWLAETRIPVDPAAAILLRASVMREPAPARGLLYHPRAAALAVMGPPPSADQLRAALDAAGLAPASLAVVVASASGDAATVAGPTDAPVRLIDGADQSPSALARSAAGPDARILHETDRLAIAVAGQPLDPERVGRPRGRLSVVGLGPGAAGWLTPEARGVLGSATDFVGYATYLDMLPPEFAATPRHGSDNREELARARAALALAAEGRRVAVISSGDPGIFAMAAAVMEALETPEPGWHAIELDILPGISAMQAAASRVGAPLGHDFAVVSLSDNLKPWPVILDRLKAAAAADFVLALYNPVSQARPHQLGEALALLRSLRAAETPVVLGRDVGRPAERVRVTTLRDVEPAMADMRTVILIGSSRTRRLEQGGRTLVYTPRRYDPV
jgi:cobalt-precorrin 5A hydrolase/precorrin-3B C17-methyltransferase